LINLGYVLGLLGVAATALARYCSEKAQQAHQETMQRRALVEEVAGAHGGSVGVQSQLGQGGIFEVVLPCS